MTRQDYIKDHIERFWPKQFEDHVASVYDLSHPEFSKPPASLLKWRAPGTSINACHYVLRSAWLMVHGDLFEAVYQWSEPITLDFLASLDHDYFLSKCRASPEGRRWELWDDEVGASAIEEYREDILKSMDHLQRLGEMAVDDITCVVDGTNQEHVGHLANGVYHRTGDAELASAIRSCGLVPHPMALGHFVGIQMAVKQLKEKGITCPT